MNGKPYKVGFADMWSGHMPENNYVYQVMRKHFPVEISPQPDYLIYSVFGSTHGARRFDRCVKIFYTGENIRPDMAACDFALSFDHLDHPRHLRFPLYACHCGHTSLIKSSPPSPTLAHRKFCNFIFSNRNPQERIEFFKLLSSYRQVDSGGSCLNNIGYKVKDKLAFISNYKFTIAFENASYPGYTTEKLVQPMVANSLPIYWGNPLVEKDFDVSSFVVVEPRTAFDRAIQTIVRLDSDDDAYLAMLAKPWFHNNRLNAYCEPGYLLPFLEKVFAAKPSAPATERK